MIKKLLAVSTAAVSLLFVLIAMPAPAFADGVGAQGYITVYEGCGSSDVGYCGLAWPIAVRHGVCQNFPSYINDKNSAVDNWTGYRARFYKDANCGVPYWDIYGHTKSGALTSGQGKNSWSSVRTD
jgi:hypothetical protein